MVKQRIWAIEIRPYGVGASGNFFPISKMTELFVVNSRIGLTGTGYTVLRGAGLGKIDLNPTDGAWVEWSRSYSFQELREKVGEALELFGRQHVRIVEVHEVDTIVLPNA